MLYRILGFTQLELSVVGLGTWAIGGSGWQFGWGSQDDRDSIAAIRRAFELGVNWIDTAAVYGMGHSEEVVGKVIRELPEKPIIATKCGRLWREDGSIYGHIKRDSIRREAENSLRRLGIDVIDLYQIHWPDPPGDIEEAWEEIAKLVEEGKVRYAGVSNFAVRHLERIKDIHPIASLQPPYSMLKRDIENDILPYCAANNIGVIAYSPMQKGLLTGTFSTERAANLPPDDHRKRDPMFNEPLLSKILSMLEELKPIAERDGRTLAQLAISWVLNRPEMTAAIVGARKASQVDEIVSAGNRLLSENDAASVNEILGRFSQTP